MKRLLIAGFSIISIVTLAAVAGKQQTGEPCPEKVCCKQAPAKQEHRTDYIFWQPVNRLMTVIK